MNTAAANVNTPATSRGWIISLWIVQIILVGVFGMSGTMKLFTPIPELSVKVFWTKDVPELMVRFIGASELLGALGLLLPSLLRIKPNLTVLAGWGLTLVMILAVGFHIMRSEVPFIGINLGLGAAAAFVAWGRSRKAPIAPRS